MSAVTLILSVDRDDDVGYKAKVDTPVIGRAACLEAAEKLGIADPEDSDTNAIFQAIKTYDEEIARGTSAEVAVISGNHMNMLEGDKRIARTLTEVIEKTGVSECILVSDGAEDEYILPILQSQLKIVGIVRVTIKQLPNIEGTFYIIKKLFRDRKFSRNVLVPLGLLIVIGVVLAFILPGVTAILIVIGILGLILLIKGLDLDEYLVSGIKSIGQSFKRGKFAAIAYIAAVILIIAGIIAGLISIVTNYPNAGNASLIYNILTFLYGALVWFIIAALVASAGKFIDTIQNNIASLYKVYIAPFFIIAIGLILEGAVIYILTISPLEPFPISTTTGLILFIVFTVVGLLLAFLGIYTRPIVQKKINAWMKKRMELKAEIEEHELSGKPLYRKIKF
ncbi:MAG TPA: DUF373 family protein [Methanocorpusculum sp.]|nr:DUF373 family protein [Methanocorpusculum sp.]